MDQASNPSQNRLRALLEELESLGFYCFADPIAVAQAKQESVDSNAVFHDAAKRLYSVDIERAFEIGMSEVLDSVSEFFALVAVRIDSFSERRDAAGVHVVEANGMTYTFPSAGTLPSQPKHLGRLWRIAAERSLCVVADILRRSSVGETVYYYSLSQYWDVVFITPEMARAISNSHIDCSDVKNLRSLDI